MDKDKKPKPFLEREEKRIQAKSDFGENHLAKGLHIGNTLKPASFVTQTRRELVIKIASMSKQSNNSKSWVERVSPEKIKNNKSFHLKVTTSHTLPELARQKLEAIRQGQAKSSLLAKVKEAQTKPEVKSADQKNVKTSPLKEQVKKVIQSPKKSTPKRPPTKGRGK